MGRTTDGPARRDEEENKAGSQAKEINKNGSSDLQAYGSCSFRNELQHSYPPPPPRAKADQRHRRCKAFRDKGTRTRRSCLYWRPQGYCCAAKGGSKQLRVLYEFLQTTDLHRDVFLVLPALEHVPVRVAVSPAHLPPPRAITAPNNNTRATKSKRRSLKKNDAHACTAAVKDKSALTSSPPKTTKKAPEISSRAPRCNSFNNNLTAEISKIDAHNNGTHARVSSS